MPSRGPGPADVERQRPGAVSAAQPGEACDSPILTAVAAGGEKARRLLPAGRAARSRTSFGLAPLVGYPARRHLCLPRMCVGNSPALGPVARSRTHPGRRTETSDVGRSSRSRRDSYRSRRAVRTDSFSG